MKKLIAYLDFFSKFHGRSLFTFTLCNRIVGYSAELYSLMDELNKLMKERQGYLDSLTPRDKKLLEQNIGRSLDVFKNALKDLVKIMVDADTLIYQNVLDFEETLVKTKKHIEKELKKDKEIFIKKSEEWKALVKQINAEKKSINQVLDRLKQLEEKKQSLEEEEKTLEQNIQKEESELVYLERIACVIHQDITSFIKKLDVEVKHGLEELVDVRDMWKEWAVSGSVELEDVIRKDAIEIEAMEQKIKTLKENMDYTSVRASDFEAEFKDITAAYEKELDDEENIEAMDSVLLKALLKHIDDIVDSTGPLDSKPLKSKIQKIQKELEKEISFLRNLVQQEEEDVSKEAV